MLIEAPALLCELVKKGAVYDAYLACSRCLTRG